MNLYLLTQGTCTGYDTYDTLVVAAESAEDAVKIGPYGDIGEGNNNHGSGVWPGYTEHVSAEIIGVAVEGTKRGLILGSFNAG